jgi:cyanophycinase-like exopeptidase
MYMTKYILHGGNEFDENEDNYYFYNLFGRDLAEGANVLISIHALQEKDRNIRFLEISKRISKYCPKNLNVELAEQNSEEFIQQLKKSQVLFLRGGETLRLKEYIKTVDKFSELIKEKVIVAASAGAYILSEFYYDSQTLSISEGLGILPLKILCHYSDERKPRLELLKNHHSELPLLVLENHKTAVFYF